MNFRRQPFQFSTIDPAKRQAEFKKRFGLPTSNSDMYVDFLQPGFMGSSMREPSFNSSPRFQHRVPAFHENASKGNHNESNVDGGHKPKVRIIPIQVEGVDGDKRHRTFSGPAGSANESKDTSTTNLQKSFPQSSTVKVDKQSQPKVCNVPIQVEPREEKAKTVEKPKVVPTSTKPEPLNKLKTELNGCAASKEKKEDNSKSLQFKQIDKVLDKLNEYKEEVEKFSGTSKDKQYRYLDEMLTRCMLDLDNVDTMGLDEIRKARKEAVRQIQRYVDLLDSKVNVVVEKMDSNSASVENPVEASIENDLDCDIPAENSSDEKDLVPSKDVTEETTTPVEVEMGESSSKPDGLEMDEEKVVNGVSSETVNEKMEISSEDRPIDSADAFNNEGVNDSLMHEETTTRNDQDIEMKECETKSGIVIEELDNTADSEPEACGDNISCLVSESPEFSAIETIVEESGSDVVIEEIEDNASENHCVEGINSSVDRIDNDKELIVEQLNNSNLTQTSDNTPVKH